MSADAVRIGTVERKTTETQIALTLTIDGTGMYEVTTGIRFFDHMLELFTRHGGFDLTLKCKGDLDVDQHHTVEDVGIALGVGYFPSAANFLLMKIGVLHKELVEAMRRHGVLLRDRSSDPGCDGYVRITIGVEEQVTKGLEALKESLEGIEWRG